ncbi:hypothetical protein B4U80_13280 [Leptotrombidium deliense]|uniref:Uncharacterized protein n=1 Tax=Leptotrombidium deliense TaxID=299467 RepID=A0A443S943_9ACAR|nr:hypothetical protein B4U80_13280 [Leptotrombidium deliense]
MLLFVDKYFWEYDFAKNQLSQKREIKNYWREIDTPISAASTGVNGSALSTYFIKGSDFWWYNNKDNDVLATTFVRMAGVKAEFNFEVAAFTIVTAIIALSKTKVVVCDSAKRIYFCDLSIIAQGVFFQNCTAQPPRLLPESTCTALSRNSDKTYMIVGSKTIIESPIGTIKTERKFEINDIFKCEKGQNIVLKIFIIGIIVLVVINIICIVFSVYKKRKQHGEMNKQSDETTMDDDDSKSVAPTTPSVNKEIQIEVQK